MDWSELDIEDMTAELVELMDVGRPTQRQLERQAWLIREIGRWEDENVVIPLPTPIEAVRFAMEQRDLKQVDIAPMFGGAPKVSEFLSGKRSLSKEQVVRIHKGLGISLDCLLEIKT